MPNECVLVTDMSASSHLFQMCYTKKYPFFLVLIYVGMCIDDA